MTHRLFAALPLPTNITEAFYRYCDDRKKEVADTQHTLRFVPKENYHITLMFFGNIEESVISTIEVTITEITRITRPFELDFETIYFAPPVYRSRMVWAIYRKNEAFEELIRKMHKEIGTYVSLRVNANKDEYIPHVTLIRSHGIIHSDNINLPSITFYPKYLKMESLYLYESILHPDGAVYTVRSMFPFIGK
jgi:2'-5' RNA ligase